MDNRANLHDSFFSRTSTPPTNPLPPPPDQHPFSPHLGSNSSPSLIDAFFPPIAPPDEQHISIDHPVEKSESAVQNESVTNSATATDRQNALLSLLPATNSRSQSITQPPQVQPQQVPTPPGSSSRSNASPQQPTDPQKFLEQMMSGTSSRTTNYSDSQRSNQQAPSPPFSQRDDYRSFAQSHGHSTETSPRPRPIQQQPQAVPPQQQQQQQPPPSPRRSIFDYTSPFDLLATKKKPAPVPMPNPAEDAWNTVIDPKRQSVENLLENLTRPVPVSQPQPPAYEAYLSTDFQQPDSTPPSTTTSTRAPLPPIPTNQKPVSVTISGGAIPLIPNPTSSPRGGSPKPLHRPQARGGEVYSNSNNNNNAQTSIYPGSGNRRDKESPSSRGGSGGSIKSGSQRIQQPQAKFSKPPTSPGPQSQTIVFDVSQQLDEIQARDSVKSTAIALVRQDAVFLPGTTIGATHWVAYAMTRGRVRVISRSSGDRTLLQLPQIFASSSSVIDMAVYGNRLAGVTSDGGFVVWELPELITDDVPGQILLCVPPTNDHDAIRSVKWHPKDPDTLAIASESRIVVIDLTNTHALHIQPLPHSDLYHIGQVFNVPSTVVAFDFDVEHYSLATISKDSNLTIWNMQDSLPYASHRIYGDDTPSSLTFVDGGIVVGRRSGTIFQLLSMSTKNILSTIRFVNGLQDDPDMFGHISYDARIQALWVANSRRDSLIALKLHFDPSYTSASGSEDGGYIDQVVEFSGIKPTIHFVILTADSDPHGDEAHAACIAAKIPPGELALVAFSVHSSGVDQVLIRKEWFDSGLVHAESKFPWDIPPPPSGMSDTTPTLTAASTATKPQSQLQIQTQTQNQGQPSQSRNPLPMPPAAPHPQTMLPPPPFPAGSIPPLPIATATTRGRTTPPSEDIENDLSEGRSDIRGSGGRGINSNSGAGANTVPKGKNVNWKEKEENAKDKEKNAKLISDAMAINESALGQALTREIKKTEDNLHTKLGRLIGKEMDKQNQRFEEVRLHEQAEEFTRQEKILKLISSELTRNTTRVVEQAVKNEVQQSVLPSLESITRAEVKAVVNEQVANGLIEVVNRGLPGEIEKMLLRPSISSHYANLLTQTLMPVLERQVKDTLSSAFLQFHAQHSANLQQEMMRELRNELSVIKSDLGSWHGEALRSQEATIRELERTVRSLSEQVKYLSISNAGPPSATLHHLQQAQHAQNSPAGPQPPQLQGTVGTSHLRQVNLPPPSQAPQPQSGNGAYNGPLPPFQHQHAPAPPSHQQQQPLSALPSSIHQQWYPGIAAPQASHPATIPQPPMSSGPQDEKTPPPAAAIPPPSLSKADQWDELYLGVLTSQDVGKLRDLLARTNPEVVLPLNSPPLVSQAVILTLVHRLSGIVGETAPNDELFKTMLWWLQRVANLLRPDDKLIADFIPRVVPTVQQSLNTTKQRLAILPGGSGTIEAARQLTDVQEILRRKAPV